MSPKKTLRALIVDDELLARQRIEHLLEREEDVEIAGQAERGKEAVEAIRTLQPDLVFLDVQMPQLSGIDVVRRIGAEHMPRVIFVTAYDQYALDAFELAALDYLVKPFENERFEQALDRARKQILQHSDLNALHERLETFLEDQAAAPSSKEEETDYLERISVNTRGQVRVVPVDEIDFIAADGSYARLHAGDDAYLIRERMQKLEDRLDPDQFMRIHRSHIVQIDRIEAMTVKKGGNYTVRLRGGQRLKVSRGRYEKLRERLGADL